MSFMKTFPVLLQAEMLRRQRKQPRLKKLLGLFAQTGRGLVLRQRKVDVWVLEDWRCADGHGVEVVWCKTGSDEDEENARLAWGRYADLERALEAISELQPCLDALLVFHKRRELQIGVEIPEEA